MIRVNKLNTQDVGLEFVFTRNEKNKVNSFNSFDKNSHKRSFYTQKINESDFSNGQDFSNTNSFGSNMSSDEGLRKSSRFSDSTSKALRTLPADYSDVEIKDTPRKKRAPAKVKYLNTPKKKQRVKTSKKEFKLTWFKFWWCILFCLGLRLVFMERGVIDYLNTQSYIEEKVYELSELKKENKSLVHEIHEIKVNPVYQRKLAREHLGVIAQNEYLILFAGE